MRKLIFQMSTSLDGFFEGPNGELDWQMTDGSYEEYINEFFEEFDALLFGRFTFQGTEKFWTAPHIVETFPTIVERLNNVHKIVFSRTLESVDWKNVRLVKENVVEEILRLKNQPGKDMATVGSSRLAVSFIELGLIDEFRILVNPVVLGRGTSLLTGIPQRLNLRLVKSQTYNSGTVALHYVGRYSTD